MRFFQVRKKRGLILGLCGALIICSFGFCIFEKAKYDEMFQWINNPIFETQLMGEEEERYIDNVIKNWKIESQLYPDVGIEKTLAEVGQNNGVDSIVKLGGNNLPGFSVLNNNRNQRSIKIAGMMDLLAEQTIDNTMYYRDGLVYLKWKKRDSNGAIQIGLGGVQVYEDDENGIRSTFYINLKESISGNH